MAAPGGRLGTLIALAALATAGFTVGAVAGIVWEEPRLVLAYLSGDTTEITWSTEGIAAADPEAAARAVAPEPPASASAAAPLPEAARVAAAIAEPSPPPPVAAPPPATERLAIQVGAFARSESAEELANRLTQGGFPAYVTPGASAGDARWRVRVGPVQGRAEADRIALRLKREQKLPTWVLAEDGG
jgi:cell division protein FtsN